MGKRTDLKTFSMNEATFNHLDLIAKRCGCSRSSVLAILINNYYEFMISRNYARKAEELAENQELARYR